MISRHEDIHNEWTSPRIWHESWIFGNRLAMVGLTAEESGIIMEEVQ